MVCPTWSVLISLPGFLTLFGPAQNLCCVLLYLFLSVYFYLTCGLHMLCKSTLAEINPTQEPHPTYYSPLSEIIRPQMVEVHRTQERRHTHEDDDDLPSGRPGSAGDREVDGHEALEGQQHDHPRRTRTVPEDKKPTSETGEITYTPEK